MNSRRNVCENCSVTVQRVQRQGINPDNDRPVSVGPSWYFPGGTISQGEGRYIKHNVNLVWNDGQMQAQTYLKNMRIS